MRILLVEDDQRVATLVTEALTAEGHHVTRTADGGSTLNRLLDEQFDAAVIDIGLPDISGLDLCRAVRDQGLPVPILLLTARAEVPDRVAGLDAGADDYLGKPFATPELLARVRALGRRAHDFGETTRLYQSLTIDKARREVLASGAPIALTPREFDIVALLAWRDGRVVSREEILESIWGDSSDKARASFDVLLVRIRRKLAKAGYGEAIRNVKEIGYSWTLGRSKRA